MSALPDWKTITKAERERLFRSYIDAGFSFAQISDKFENCSRNAAIGLAHRLKLPSRRRATASKVSPSPNPKPNKSLIKDASGLLVPVPMRGPNNPHRNDFKGRAEQRAAAPGVVIRREFAFDPLPDTLPIPFLTNTGCRWPVDGVNGPGLIACGAAKDIERSYCEAHHHLSYQSPTTRQAAVIRSAERIR